MQSGLYLITFQCVLGAAWVQPHAAYGTACDRQRSRSGWRSLTASIHMSVALSEEVRASYESLFPPEGYDMRNAKSRTDGYWKFISKKEEPPSELVYGEFPLDLFLELLDRAAGHAGLSKDRSDARMADIGSGVGRLVLWAAVNQKWRHCLGVEILPGIHDIAVEKLEEARAIPGLLQSDAITFECGSWSDSDVAQLDVVFAATTCSPVDEATGELIGLFGEGMSVLNSKLKRGCVVVTTEYKLGDGFRYIESLDGDHPLCETCTNDWVQRDACHTGAPTEGNACLWQPEWGS